MDSFPGPVPGTENVLMKQCLGFLKIKGRYCYYPCSTGEKTGIKQLSKMMRGKGSNEQTRAGIHAQAVWLKSKVLPGPSLLSWRVLRGRGSQQNPAFPPTLGWVQVWLGEGLGRPTYSLHCQAVSFRVSLRPGPAQPCQQLGSLYPQQ